MPARFLHRLFRLALGEALVRYPRRLECDSINILAAMGFNAADLGQPGCRISLAVATGRL